MKRCTCILLSFLMMMSVAGCSGTSEKIFEGKAQGFGGEISAKVTFKNDKITKVEILGPKETEGIGSKAVAELPQNIVDANGTNIDKITGATISSDAIISAVNKAIKLKNGETSTAISYKAGTYQAVAKGFKDDIKVEVEFNEKSMTSIRVVEQKETYGIGQGMDTSPVNALPQQILDLQGLGLDTITGATVTSNAILSAVGDAASQAGADVESLKEIKPETKKQDMTYDVDVVVVGGGSTGLSAAISAANEGANVLLVEKQGLVGGAAARSGGKLMAAGTDVQKAAGILDTPEKMFDYLKSVGGDYIDNEKLLAFCNNSLEVYNWMVELGVEVQDVEPIHKSLDTWRVHNTLGGGGMTDGFGGNITVPLYEQYKKSEGELLYNTTVQEILVNDKNEVTGVKGTKSDGSVITVNAKSVIIATGGYAQNKEMVTSYDEKFPYYVTSVPTGNVGDGIKMVEAIGGQIENNPAVQAVYLNFYSGVGINEEPGLIVSNQGQRVANEFSYQYHVGDALAQAKSTSGWYIATANDPTPTVQYAMTLDTTLKAASIEELAGLMKVDAVTLKTTIDRYNELAKKKADDDFGKPAEYLYPIEGEMYYALEMLPSVTVTYSGIVTDINAQVLDANNQPIANLYAAGETAFPGLFGTEYPGCGMAISGGAYYGRIAGQQAASQK